MNREIIKQINNLKMIRKTVQMMVMIRIIKMDKEMAQIIMKKETIVMYLILLKEIMGQTIIKETMIQIIKAKGMMGQIIIMGTKEIKMI